MPGIKTELKDKVYQKFISEALKRSDMLSFTLRMDFVNYPLSLPEFYPNLDRQAQEYWDKRIVEDKAFKEIFHTQCLNFVEKFLPYQIKHITRSYWPGTAVLPVPFDPTPRSVPEIYFCRSDLEAASLLLEPGRLYAWKYPYYPDDLCFYKEGKCWFLTTAHEDQANLYADSEEDVQNWRALGLEFYYGFNPKIDLSDRWDENNIDLQAWFG